MYRPKAKGYFSGGNMRHGSLFSGMGGFDLAAQWMGWENVFHCEWNEFGQKILKHYWPEAETFGDITKSDFTKYANTIDILSGGFPCQPYSTAGKRKGKEDERHLWPEMLRAIREISPRWVVGENVRGLTNWNGGMVFDEVQADLEAEGYEVLPFLLPACAVDAPHRRDRIWFVAHTSGLDTGWKGRQSEADLYGGQMGQHEQEGSEIRSEFGATIESGAIAYPESIGVERNWAAGQQKSQAHAGQGLPVRRGSGTDWHEWPTQSPICSGNDGLSTRVDLTAIPFPKWRNESIKAVGNAVVPQVVYEIFKAIEAYEKLTEKNA